MKRIISIIATMFVVSCGTYSINKSAEIERQDKKRFELENENRETKDKAEYFKRLLSNVKKSDSFLYTTVTVRFGEQAEKLASARKDCKEIGFELPDESDLPEIDLKLEDGSTASVITEQDQDGTFVVCVKR